MLTTLEKAVEALRALFYSWREQYEPTNDVSNTNLLTALSLTVHQLRDEVDNLKSRLEPADSAKS
jgi:hypothetical protein